MIKKFFKNEVNVKFAYLHIILFILFVILNTVTYNLFQYEYNNSKEIWKKNEINRIEKKWKNDLLNYDNNLVAYKKKLEKYYLDTINNPQIVLFETFGYREVNHMPPPKPLAPIKEIFIDNYQTYLKFSNTSISFWEIDLKRNIDLNIIPYGIILSSIILLLIFINYIIDLFKRNNLIKNILILIVSFDISFLLLNYYIRYYISKSWYAFPYFSYAISLIFLVFILFVVNNYIYSYIKIHRNYFFIKNSGIQRLFLIVFLTTSSYYELLIFIRNDFLIKSYQWKNIIEFYNDNPNYIYQRIESIANTYYSGLFILFTQIVFYLLFLWIYNGFKKKI